MNCSNCNASNKPSAKFCTTCGSKIANKEPKTENTINCNKCLSPLKLGAKFCTSCGSPNISCTESVNESSLTNQHVYNGSNYDNTNITNKNDTGKEGSSMSVIKDKIFWNIQDGEIAHRFNEADLIQYESAKGIIINEGSTAYIKADGVLIAELNGGTYDFVEPQQLQQILETRQGGIASGLRRGFRFISNLVMGTRIKDKIENNSAQQNIMQQNNLSNVIENMKKNQVFAVTLKIDKSFQIPFGRIEDSDGNKLESLIIKTKLIDMEFAVDAFFKIDDFKKFAQHYLSDKSSVTKINIHNELFPLIRAAIQDVMYDVEMTENRLSDELIQKISDKINATADNLFYGLKLEKIITISSNNEDLERFRSLSRELYLSERELENLIRLNEFSNRLSLQQNAQRLIEARNDFEFHKELQVINNTRFLYDERTALDVDNERQSIQQERLLSEDDLDKFYMVLSREKRIREANNEDEIQTALIEIEKTGLLREEDIASLKRSIRERNEDLDMARFHSIDIIQINHTLEIDRKNLEWEYEIGDKRIELEIDRRRKELQAEIGFTELEIEQWKKEDDYKDSRFYTDLQKNKSAELQDIEIDATRRKTIQELENDEMNAQLERMQKLKEIEAKEAAQKHEQEIAARAQELLHQKELTQLDKEKTENLATIYKDMSFEQIMAANPNLSPEVAAQLAKKFEAEAEAEKFKFAHLQNDTRIQDAKENADKQQEFLKEQMLMQERMMGNMMNTASAMTGHLVDNKDQQKEEYRERLERQESRMDTTQDKALDYTTRNNSFNTVSQSSTPPPAPSDYFVNLPGQQSVPRSIEVLQNMVKSGEILDVTSIYSPLTNSWVMAITISELKRLFTEKAEVKSKSVSCKKCGFDNLDAAARFCPECGNEP